MSSRKNNICNLQLELRPNQWDKRKNVKNVAQGEQLQNGDQSSEFSRHEVACDSPDCKVWLVVVPTKDAQTLFSRRFTCGFCVSTVRQNH
ncbi:hypothetical protein GJ496_008861 [Pomphorhynchus laevis]|nr:hypothetical protein GJ496_008861 [Pomphorhynchus laevis]